MGPRELVPFTVAAPPKADNGSATVRIQWKNPDTNWFLFILDPQGSLVGESYGTYGDAFDEVQLLNPIPGTYTAVIEDFAQASNSSYDDWSGTVKFADPQAPVTGVKESWTLT